jgi:hypothetical protein
MPGKWFISVRNFTIGCLPRKESRHLIFRRSLTSLAFPEIRCSIEPV